MILVKCTKILVFAATMLPIALAALGCAVLFGSFTIACAKNPEETERMYGSTLVAFALMETFVFLGLVVGILVNIIL